MIRMSFLLPWLESMSDVSAIVVCSICVLLINKSKDAPFPVLPKNHLHQRAHLGGVVGVALEDGLGADAGRGREEHPLQIPGGERPLVGEDAAGEGADLIVDVVALSPEPHHEAPELRHAAVAAARALRDGLAGDA